jgi:hypothetical protein
VIFPAESILSYGWVAGYVLRRGDDKRGDSRKQKTIVAGAHDGLIILAVLDISSYNPTRIILVVINKLLEVLIGEQYA